jgi:hypothetical protein
MPQDKFNNMNRVPPEHLFGGVNIAPPEHQLAV